MAGTSSTRFEERFVNASSRSGVESVYDFWLGLLPQFLSQFGIPAGASVPQAIAAAPTLPFPADQIAKAATMTRGALQAMAQAYAPMLQAAGASGLLGQWSAALPYIASMQQAFAGATTPGVDPGAMAAGMTLPFARQPGGARSGDDAPAAAALPLAQMQQAWLEAGSRLLGGSAETHAAAFDRTFGALSDALGFGPLRKLQAAGQALISAAVEQNDARTRYAMLVQGAFAAGFDALLARLAATARAGERIDSVLGLLRLWAACTEDAVHEVLQSEQGLAATAAIARAGFAYRRKLQDVAAIVADALDMSTRRDLDEAYREIQALKREVRALKPAVVVAKPPARRARSTKRKPT
jgi:hypothetical protein